MVALRTGARHSHWHWPLDPPTHWEQVYAPVATVFDCHAGDELGIGIEAGISLCWEVTQKRGTRIIARCAHDIGRGFMI